MYLCRYFYRISFLRRNFQLSRTRIDKINKYENLRQKFGNFSAIPSDLWLLTFAAEFIEKSIVALNATCRKKNGLRSRILPTVCPKSFWLFGKSSRLAAAKLARDSVELGRKIYAKRCQILKAIPKPLQQVFLTLFILLKTWS